MENYKSKKKVMYNLGFCSSMISEFNFQSVNGHTHILGAASIGLAVDVYMSG